MLSLIQTILKGFLDSRGRKLEDCKVGCYFFECCLMIILIIYSFIWTTLILGGIWSSSDEGLQADLLFTKWIGGICILSWGPFGKVNWLIVSGIPLILTPFTANWSKKNLKNTFFLPNFIVKLSGKARHIQGQWRCLLWGRAHWPLPWSLWMGQLIQHGVSQVRPFLTIKSEFGPNLITDHITTAFVRGIPFSEMAVSMLVKYSPSPLS